MSFKIQALQRIKRKIQIDAVLDIGVNTHTPELISSFPDIHHYLYEIDPTYNEVIKKNYSSLSYSLSNVGLSDKNGSKYINSFSIHGTNQITHTVIRDKPINEHKGMPIIQSKEVEIKRLDQLDDSFPARCLLKIDVDGTDLNVFKGAENSIESIAVVIIESTTNKLLETIATVSSHSFFLADMADIIYYGDSIYQMDLIFIHSQFKHLFVENIHPFKPNQWKHYLAKNGAIQQNNPSK